MPNYTYMCLNEECNVVTDTFHLMNEKLLECPKCLGSSLKKLPSKVFINSKDATLKKKAEEIYKNSLEETKETLSVEKQHLKDRKWNS